MLPLKFTACVNFPGFPSTTKKKKEKKNSSHSRKCRKEIAVKSSALRATPEMKLACLLMAFSRLSSGALRTQGLGRDVAGHGVGGPVRSLSRAHNSSLTVFVFLFLLAAALLSFLPTHPHCFHPPSFLYCER